MSRLDLGIRILAVVALTLIAAYVYDLRGDVQRLSGPVCAQLRDVTDRTRFVVESGIARNRNVLALHERGVVPQTPQRVEAIHRELAILEHQLADTKEPPC